MMKIEFENRVKNFHGGVRVFLPILNKGMKILGKLPGFQKMMAGGLAKKGASGSGEMPVTLMLTLVSDREIHKLNKEYRGVDKPTDVLSFSYFGEERFPGDDVVGEIVISVPTARRQAKDHKKTLHQELQFLFLHGLLHVFGFDHITRGERKKMFDLQDKIIGDKSWRAIAETESQEEY